MSIGVVLTHFNRANLLRNTLYSFTFAKEKDVEIVIVDDGSIQDERNLLRKVVNEFRRDYNLNINCTGTLDKWYSNPCIPFNIGIGLIDSDIVLLQSAECIHLGGIIDYTVKNMQADTFISYACYSLDRVQTEKVATLDFKDKSVNNNLLDVINPPNNAAIRHCEESGWYNHSEYRPLGFHWCNAYNTKELLAIKKFDERYAMGIAYDDNEFIFRCKRDLQCKMVDSPLVLHQWHGLHNYYKESTAVENQLKQNYNKALFEHITTQEPDNANVVNHLSRTVNTYSL